MTTTKRILAGYRKMKKYLIHAVLQVLFTVPVYLIPALIGSIAGTLVDSVLIKNQALRLNTQFLLIGATVVRIGANAVAKLFFSLVSADIRAERLLFTSPVCVARSYLARF